jgi:hypothetical protein
LVSKLFLLVPDRLDFLLYWLVGGRGGGTA